MSQNLRVAELDFDSIKENLKTFLRAKPEFTDYNFEGSGLSVIMDLLAYNTHYNAVLANMFTQEMFLDTAVKRETVALHAKRLGYTPKSARASFALIDLEIFPSGSPGTLTLGKGGIFTTNIQDNITLTFTTRDATTITPVDSRYIFSNLKIYEGSLQTFRYVVNLAANQKFEIPTPNVDTSLLKVFIQESISNTAKTEYVFYNTIVDIDSTSSVYFTNLNENGRYEITFGDGVLGKEIQDGNVVILEYVETNGAVGNGSRVFSFTDGVEGHFVNTITTVSNAVGGSAPETIDEIKENAKKNTLIQDRAVTYSDYKTVISNLLALDSISVWGGEDNIPPVYGKVFISVKLAGTEIPLSRQGKDDIIAQIRPKKVLSITPEFVDPQYMFIIVESKVLFDRTKTTLSDSQMRTLVFNDVKTFLDANLKKFDTSLRYSAFVSAIDDVEESIISNSTAIKLKRIITPFFNKSVKYTVDFQHEIKQSTPTQTEIISSRFKIADTPFDVIITDNNGILQLEFFQDENQRVFIKNIGTVDYESGVLSITDLVIQDLVETELYFVASPVNLDTVPKRNTILTYRDSDIAITTI